jgi:pimeloyl-ACP methyl ester carboxylesterase
MERVLRLFLSGFSVTFIIAILVFAGCSSDDGPTDPNPNPDDTTGNNDTSKVEIDDKVRPIIFVHGTFEAADVFTQLTQRFALNDYTEDQLVVFDIEDYFTGTEIDITKMATQLSTQVDELLARVQETRIDIIAHGSGANAVQHWLVHMDGTEKAAHVVYAGGSFDMTLTVEGDLTPGPCKYLTLRSDGADALQNGNAEYGVLAGAKNEQLPGLDNLELLSHRDAFGIMYAFLAGDNPDELNMPNARIGMTYELKGRLVDFIDNTPVAGAMVVPIKIRTLSSGEVQRQSSGSILTTDADGYFAFTDEVGPEQHLEVLVRSGSQSHYDMHIYRQPWRANSHTERLRIIPRSAAGSDLLRSYSSAIRTGNYAVMLVMSQNRTLQYGRDEVKVRRFDPAFDPLGEIDVLTASNAPAAGAAGQYGNTSILTLLDYDQNGQDGSGPINASGLNNMVYNSFDCFLNAETTGYQTQIELNGRTLGVNNYRSSGSSGSNNAGINLIQFEY